MPRKTPREANPLPALSKAPRKGDPATGDLSIGPELTKAIRAINGDGSVPGEGMLGRYWELGQLVEALVKTRKDRPGSAALAKSLGVEVTRLKAALKIFNAFPSIKARDRLLALRRADGSRLPVQAIARLCSPSLGAEREAVIERACRENWSEYDAKDKLKASRRGDPVSRTGGRKHRPPRSLPLALARWHREADGLIRSVQAASRPEVIAGLLAAPDAAEVTAEDVREVRRVVQRALVALMSQVQTLDKIADELPTKPTGVDRSATRPPTPETKSSTEASKSARAKRRSRT